jgi:hypothetical protein
VIRTASREAIDRQGVEVTGTTGIEMHVKFDGVYVQTRRDIDHFIRFFPAGLAMAVSVARTKESLTRRAEHVATWLLPEERERLGAGEHELTDRILKWDDVAPEGVVQYRGIVSEHATELHLHTHSLINGHESYGVWRFIPSGS